MVLFRVSQVTLVVKNPSANAGNIRDTGSVLGSEEPLEWQPTPVFLPGESHEQRSPTSSIGSQRVGHD